MDFFTLETWRQGPFGEPEPREGGMFKHYCNERGCPGHVKSWERCADRRIFKMRPGPGYENWNRFGCGAVSAAGAGFRPLHRAAMSPRDIPGGTASA